MIPDLENDLVIDENKYDELKAYKIIKGYYDDAKAELKNFKDRADKQKIMIIEKEKQIFEFKASHDENVDLFSPAVLQTNYNETLDLYNHELVSLKDTSNYLSECILNATEKVAEYSFLLKVLEKKNTDRTSFNNMDEIINKIDFCISLIEVDRERVKEELFHVKHLLS